MTRHRSDPHLHPPRRIATAVPAWVTEVPAQVRAPLDLTGLATAYTATWARREFAVWLGVDLAVDELHDDLVLAVYEALANCADHAYPAAEEPGPVRLLARRSDGAARITVSDHGTWREPGTVPTVRGRGLSVITLLVRDVHVETGPTGTTVHLRAPLPAPPPGTGPRVTVSGRWAG